MFERLYDNDDLPPKPIPIPTEWVLYAMTAYFTGTAAIAWKRAAIDHNYKSHQDWIIRHVGSGIWIAVQRVLLFVVLGPIFYRPPVPKETQRNVFGQAAQLGWFISVSAAEYAIYLLRNSKSNSNSNNNHKRVNSNAMTVKTKTT